MELEIMSSTESQTQKGEYIVHYKDDFAEIQVKQWLPGTVVSRGGVRDIENVLLIFRLKTNLLVYYCTQDENKQ